MAILRAVVLMGIGAGAVLGSQALLEEDQPPARRDGAAFEQRPSRNPDDPPVVWVHGAVESLTEDLLVVRAGRGPAVSLNRLGGGATSFLTLEGGTWREAEPGGLAGARGQPVCVEAALDGRTLLALRVFLGSTCGPA